MTNPGTAPISLRGSGCNINPPRRWLGYDSAGRWRQNLPAQFSRPRCRSASCSPPIPGAASSGRRALPASRKASTSPAHQLRLLPRLRQPAHRKRADQRGDERHARSLLVLPPNRRICARNGGGGDYLSNESAYRNTVLRDAFRLEDSRRAHPCTGDEQPLHRRTGERRRRAQRTTPSATPATRPTAAPSWRRPGAAGGRRQRPGAGGASRTKSSPGARPSRPIASPRSQTAATRPTGQ
ncbi:hypothetical protein ACPA9J_14870 [Pseudomonas aeruginosa]